MFLLASNPNRVLIYELIRTEDERLHMLWSTNAKSGYVEAMAHSSNDDLNYENGKFYTDLCKSVV